jgi:hypothetical protein
LLVSFLESLTGEYKGTKLSLGAVFETGAETGDQNGKKL